MTVAYHERVYSGNTFVFGGLGINRAMDTLASRLTMARTKRGLSQSALAGLAGVSQSTIGNIEAGIRDGGTSLASIAHALRVSYFWLRDGSGAMELALAPDAEAIADAFNSLPDESDEQAKLRDWAYASIMAQLTAMRGGQGDAPAQAPDVRPTPGPRPRLKKRP